MTRKDSKSSHHQLKPHQRDLRHWNHPLAQSLISFAFSWSSPVLCACVPLAAGVWLCHLIQAPNLLPSLSVTLTYISTPALTHP